MESAGWFVMTYSERIMGQYHTVNHAVIMLLRVIVSSPVTLSRSCEFVSDLKLRYSVYKV